MSPKEDRKRSSLEIISEILCIARKGARKTHIVYDANLNFKILEKYLKNLKHKGLLTCPEDTNLIKTTEKGEKYLKKLHQLNLISSYLSS